MLGETVCQLDRYVTDDRVHLSAAFLLVGCIYTVPHLSVQVFIHFSLKGN